MYRDFRILTLIQIFCQLRKHRLRLAINFGHSCLIQHLNRFGEGFSSLAHQNQRRQAVDLTEVFLNDPYTDGTAIMEQCRVVSKR